jgi:UDP-glucose 4-epimerase
LEKGDTVYVVDNLSTGSYENISDLFEKYPDKLVYENDSILNDNVMKDVTENVDVVVHLAAAVGVKYIIENPLSAMETNILGTENVLKWVNKFKKKIFIASSSEVYGDQEKAPLSEEDSVIYGPSDKLRWSYAASKLVDEFIALAYYRTSNTPVVVGRLFNIIGTNQTGRYGMVVPGLIRQALKNEPLTVYGNGKQTRTFTYVEDTVWAIMKMMENPNCIGRIINIGGLEEISIYDLAKKIIALTNSSSEIKLVPYEKVYSKDFDDMRRRVPSLKKAKELINYQPEYNLEQSLKLIINSIRKNIKQESSSSSRQNKIKKGVKEGEKSNP